MGGTPKSKWVDHMWNDGPRIQWDRSGHFCAEGNNIAGKLKKPVFIRTTVMIMNQTLDLRSIRLPPYETATALVTWAEL
jgi:hypothetical protein